MKPKLFISYTTRGATEADETRNRDRAQELSRRFTERGKVEPLLDRERIEKGKPWRPVLHEMLARAHGGVIVISREALNSEWVAQEAAILEHRRRRSDWFALMPVLVDGVQAGDLARSRLEAVDLADLQAFAGDDETVLSEIVEAVEEHFASWQPRSAESEVRDKVFDRLRGIHHSVLRSCARELDLSVDGILADEKLSDLLAREIADRMISILVEGKIQPILTGLQALHPALDRKAATVVFDTVVPFCVDRGAAVRLRKAVLGNRERAAVGVNARLVATAELYARRASIPLSNWTINATLNRYGEEPDAGNGPAVDSEGAPVDVVAEVETVLCRKLKTRPAKLARKISTLVTALKQPQLMVISGEIDDDQLETLENKYEHLRLFVLTAEKKPSTPEWHWKRVEFLDPELADDAEAEGGEGAFALHGLAREALERFGSD